MDLLHKLITFLTYPMTIGLALLLLGVLFRRRLPCFLALVMLYLFATPLMTFWIGLPLEAPYPPCVAEDLPAADAICLLGGGMGAPNPACVYPEMWQSADRVWQAARLYKAGKAPCLTLSGSDARESSVALLKDFGIPEAAFRFFPAAKNTEDEARLIAQAGGVTNVLLVTSAWHMRRAEMLFRRAGLNVVPAATDYEATIRYARMGFAWEHLVPTAETLHYNANYTKEHVANFCYWLLK